MKKINPPSSEDQLEISYAEEDIESVENLDYVKLRPTGYIRDTGVAGLIHLIKEILDNGLDELMLNQIGRLVVTLCQDVNNKSFQVIVTDNGRGLPIGKMVKSYTKLHTSGKYNTKSYKYSSGLFGVGAKVVVGLSKHFRSISRRRDGTGSLYVPNGEKDNIQFVTDDTSCNDTGVTVVFEPNSNVFDGMETFVDGGYFGLVELLRRYCFFNDYHVELRIHPTPLKDDIWTCPYREALGRIQTVVDASTTIFTSTSFDRMDWLKSKWNITRPIAWTYQFDQPDTQVQYQTRKPGKGLVTVDSAMRYDIRLFYVKFEQNGNYLGMLNSVPLDNPKNTHLASLATALKHKLGGFIKDQAVKKFFMEIYKLPVFAAVNVLFSGAEFTGTTKHDFTSPGLHSVYYPSLMEHLSTREAVLALTSLYGLIEDDIVQKYQALITVDLKVKNVDRLSDYLNKPKNFKNCKTKDRQKAELFLFEGASAGSTVMRDKETQAVYYLSGKPFNSKATPETLRTAREKISKFEIYQDILMILGIDLSKPRIDPRELNFGSIIIATDADSHGYHIAEIVLSQLMHICPQLIEEGIISIVTPPLYGVRYLGKTKKGKNKNAYLRDLESYQEWMIRNVYQEFLDVSVRSDAFGQDPRRLTKHEYMDFMKLVLDIGETITNIANELVVDPVILEALSHVTQYLHHGQVDVNRISQIIGAEKVIYEETQHILIISVGKQDVTIPLQNVCDRLYASIIPKLQLIAWKKLEFFVTTKHTDRYKNTQVTLMMLYGVLKTFDKLFEVTRYKGLGQMNDTARYVTCIDPENRLSYRVTSIGDLPTIYNLLGPDSAHRKTLLSAKQG